jgi:hypothetical protein
MKVARRDMLRKLSEECWSSKERERDCVCTCVCVYGEEKGGGEKQRETRECNKEE